MFDDLKGRKIDDAPYTDLIESLSKIVLICYAALESRDDATNAELMRYISQIGEIGTDAMVFAGATPDEVDQVSQYLLSRMRFERERDH